MEMIRQTGRWSGFPQWKRDVAQQVAYTDFSGYNGIAPSDRMFMDALAHGTSVGETMMLVLLGLPLPDCSEAAVVAQSALRVTASKADALLTLQDQRRDAAIAIPSPYSTTIAAVNVKRYGDNSRLQVKRLVKQSKRELPADEDLREEPSPRRAQVCSDNHPNQW